MFATLEAIISALTTALYAQADAAIAAMCAWSWSNLFGWVAGLVIGWTLIKGLLDDDGLSESIRGLIMIIVTLSILAWLIKPGPGGCQVVQIKNDALAMRADVTELIAPGWGGDPAQSITQTTAQMRKHMDMLIRASSQTLKPGAAAEAVGAVPTLTPAQADLKSRQPLTCAEIGAPETAIYCR